MFVWGLHWLQNIILKVVVTENLRLRYDYRINTILFYSRTRHSYRWLNVYNKLLEIPYVPTRWSIEPSAQRNYHYYAGNLACEQSIVNTCVALRKWGFYIVQKPNVGGISHKPHVVAT